MKEFYPAAKRCRSARSATSTARCATPLQYKFTASPLTPKDVAGLIDILYKPPAK